MQIDWITVSAQIVNFLLLIWLLKRFLYQPVIRAMDQREQRIADRLNEAEEHKRTADDEAERYRQQSAELDQRRDELLAEAAREAREQRQRILDDARIEVIETRAGWLREAEQEKEEFIVSLRRSAADAVQVIARKALGDLADADLEDRIVHTFIERLGRLDKLTRSALVDPTGPVRIESSFALEHGLRSRLTRAVHEYLAPGIDVEYGESPDLLCGIELTSAGQRLSWNIAQFMSDLAERVEATFSPTQFASDGGG
jgi:F-type H+-transporting ATPase subunit b